MGLIYNSAYFRMELGHNPLLKKWEELLVMFVILPRASQIQCIFVSTQAVQCWQSN